MPPSTLCIVELALATQCFAQTFEYKSKLLFLITNKNQRLYLAQKSILAFSLLGEAWALDLLACNSNGRGATKGPGCAGKIMCRAGITTPARVRTRDSPQHIFGETFSVYSVFYLLRELCIPLIKLKLHISLLHGAAPLTVLNTRNWHSSGLSFWPVSGKVLCSGPHHTHPLRTRAGSKEVRKGMRTYFAALVSGTCWANPAD